MPVDAHKLLADSAWALEAPDPKCTIRANVNRSGECIYHLEGGRWYAQVKVDQVKGKRWFCTASEAEAAGYRAAKL